MATIISHDQGIIAFDQNYLYLSLDGDKGSNLHEYQEASDPSLVDHLQSRQMKIIRSKRGKFFVKLIYFVLFPLIGFAYISEHNRLPFISESTADFIALIIAPIYFLLLLVAMAISLTSMFKHIKNSGKMKLKASINQIHSLEFHKANRVELEIGVDTLFERRERLYFRPEELEIFKAQVNSLLKPEIVKLRT